MNVPVLIIPGLSNSGPGHWQTLWEQANPEFRRVEQRNWFEPEPDEWVHAIDTAIRACPRAPVVVAHSLGCIAFAHWARTQHSEVHGALLVAPADAELPDVPGCVSQFAPVPRMRFRFPAVLVGSTDDLWCSFSRAQEFANAWGATFVNAGPCGHINVASGYGPWTQGERLLRFLRTTPCRSATATTPASERWGAEAMD